MFFNHFRTHLEQDLALEPNNAKELQGVSAAGSYGKI